ncbi:hypothetical protein BDD12DRAFT_949755 [Trichophaea hybrida]|nr:hypothetical protein BDD12DRAFT_949755 [Trichophaea hybrida]
MKVNETRNERWYTLHHTKSPIPEDIRLHTNNPTKIQNLHLDTNQPVTASPFPAGHVDDLLVSLRPGRAAGDGRDGGGGGGGGIAWGCADDGCNNISEDTWASRTWEQEGVVDGSGDFLPGGFVRRLSSSGAAQHKVLVLSRIVKCVPSDRNTRLDFQHSQPLKAINAEKINPIAPITTPAMPSGLRPWLPVVDLCSMGVQMLCRPNITVKTKTLRPIWLGTT